MESPILLRRPIEHYPAAFALWYAEATGEPVPRFEKVESTKEHPQIEGDDLWPAALLPKPDRLDLNAGA